MVLRANWPDLLEPGFREIYDDAFLEEEQIFPQIFNVISSTKQDEKDSGATGFGLFVETGEQEQISYEDPLQMYDVTYTPKKYTKGFKISEELWEDDQYNVMRKKPAQLGRAARRSSEKLAADVFNNAFTSTVLGGDAQELCSTVHPRSDGGSSQSNASSTGITLTDTNLETGEMAMRKHLDDKGMRVQIMPSLLVVPVDLEKTAKILVGSNLRSGTADNDVNVYKGRYSVIAWEFITSTTAWFLMDKRQHKLNWFWRIRPEFAQDKAFETGTGLFKARFRSAVGFSDWRGTWGSKGDGATYSG